MNKQKPSPSGLGIYAKNEKLKTVKKGADGQKWIVYKDCNGVKKWKLYKKIKKGGGGKHGRSNSLEEGEIRNNYEESKTKKSRTGNVNRSANSNANRRANSNANRRANAESSGNFRSEGSRSYVRVPQTPPPLYRSNSVGRRIDFRKFVYQNGVNYSGTSILKLKTFFNDELNKIGTNINNEIQRRGYNRNDYFLKVSIDYDSKRPPKPQLIYTLWKMNHIRRWEEILHLTIHSVEQLHSNNNSKKGIHFRINRNLVNPAISRYRNNRDPIYYIPIFYNIVRKHFYVNNRTILSEMHRDDEVLCNIFINNVLIGLDKLQNKIITLEHNNITY